MPTKHLMPIQPASAAMLRDIASSLEEENASNPFFDGKQREALRIARLRELAYVLAKIENGDIELHDGDCTGLSPNSHECHCSASLLFGE